ncbi:MAG: fumarylacetoacetate hydrolase family protein [Alphaproteobacteria bacterium]|nr:fumarylacetoacetate hydrolase family protein [Alphaproteobacteria bacterium]
MKLLRFGPKGREKPGLLDSSGAIRDLSRVIKDINGDTLSPGGLAKLKKVKVEKLPKVRGKPRLGAPVSPIGKLIAVGLNYADHAAEAGVKIPDEPVLFVKTPNTYAGPNDKVVFPRGWSKMDWEVELAVVIGRRARYVSKDKALKHVAGYTICNDVSERAFQIDRGGSQWTKGKMCDGFAPLGPYVLTADEVKDPQALNMYCDVNGQRMQSGSTKTMIFDVAHLVSYISDFVTLEPGDVIITGTPPGVGLGKKPTPIFLKPGDVVTLGIDGMGEQRQVCAAPGNR